MNFYAIKYGVTVLPESWVFRGGKSDLNLPIALLFFLIKSGNKNILVDVGCDVMAGFVTPEFMKPVDALRMTGLEPADITDIFLSHSHSDHMDSVIHFPNAKVYIQKNEAGNAQKLIGSTDRLMTFDEEYRMELDDGSITAKWIGGHSPGSSVFYLTGGGKKYVLIGDEFYSPRCITENRQAGMPFNPEANRRFLDELRGGDFTPVVFHDPDLVPGALGTRQIF